MLDTMILDYT